MSTRHPYTHESQGREVPVLAFLSLLSALAFGAVCAHYKWTAPWWLDTPAVLGFYGFFAGMFDRWAWRWRLFRLFHSIPDLRGTFWVTIRSSHDQHAKPHSGTATISQTWSRIVVHLETETSKSDSRAAWLAEAGEGVRLTYVYENSPRSRAPSSLERHEGTAIVTFVADKHGEGEYYSGRGRTNHGELSFRRKNKTKV